MVDIFLRIFPEFRKTLEKNYEKLKLKIPMLWCQLQKQSLAGALLLRCSENIRENYLKTSIWISFWNCFFIMDIAPEIFSMFLKYFFFNIFKGLLLVLNCLNEHNCSPYHLRKVKLFFIAFSSQNLFQLKKKQQLQQQQHFRLHWKKVELNAIFSTEDLSFCKMIKLSFSAEIYSRQITNWMESGLMIL